MGKYRTLKKASQYESEKYNKLLYKWWQDQLKRYIENLQNKLKNYVTTLKGEGIDFKAVIINPF